MSGGGEIVIMKRGGGDRPNRYPLSAGTATLGRAHDCDIKVLLPDVAEHHAMLSVHKNGCILRNLSSEHCTLVNNEPITVHALKHADIITLSERSLRWEYFNPPDTSSNSKDTNNIPKFNVKVKSVKKSKRQQAANSRRSEIIERRVDNHAKATLELKHRFTIDHNATGKKVAVVRPQRRSDSESELKPKLVTKPHRPYSPPQLANKRSSRGGGASSTSSAATRKSLRSTPIKAGRLSAKKQTPRGATRISPAKRGTPRVQKIEEPTSIDDNKKAALMLLTGRSPAKSLAASKALESVNCSPLSKNTPRRTPKKGTPFKTTPAKATNTSNNVVTPNRPGTSTRTHGTPQVNVQTLNATAKLTPRLSKFSQRALTPRVSSPLAKVTPKALTRVARVDTPRPLPQPATPVLRKSLSAKTNVSAASPQNSQISKRISRSVEAPKLIETRIAKHAVRSASTGVVKSSVLSLKTCTPTKKGSETLKVHSSAHYLRNSASPLKCSSMALPLLGRNSNKSPTSNSATQLRSPLNSRSPSPKRRDSRTAHVDDKSPTLASSSSKKSLSVSPSQIKPSRTGSPSARKKAIHDSPIRSAKLSLTPIDAPVPSGRVRKLIRTPSSTSLTKVPSSTKTPTNVESRSILGRSSRSTVSPVLSLNTSSCSFTSTRKSQTSLQSLHASVRKSLKSTSLTKANAKDSPVAKKPRRSNSEPLLKKHSLRRDLLSQTSSPLKSALRSPISSPRKSHSIRFELENSPCLDSGDELSLHYSEGSTESLTPKTSSRASRSLKILEKSLGRAASLSPKKTIFEEPRSPAKHSPRAGLILEKALDSSKNSSKSPLSVLSRRSAQNDSTSTKSSKKTKSNDSYSIVDLVSSRSVENITLSDSDASMEYLSDASVLSTASRSSRGSRNLSQVMTSTPATKKQNVSLRIAATLGAAAMSNSSLPVLKTPLKSKMPPSRRSGRSTPSSTKSTPNKPEIIIDESVSIDSPVSSRKSKGSKGNSRNSTPVNTPRASIKLSPLVSPKDASLNKLVSPQLGSRKIDINAIAGKSSLSKTSPKAALKKSLNKTGSPKSRNSSPSKTPRIALRISPATKSMKTFSRNSSPRKSPKTTSRNSSPTKTPKSTPTNSSPSKTPKTVSRNSSSTKIPKTVSRNSSPTKTPKTTSRNSSPLKTPKTISRSSSPTKASKTFSRNPSPKKTTSRNSSSSKTPKSASRKSSPTKTPQSATRKASTSKTPKSTSRVSSPTKTPKSDTRNSSTSKTPKLASRNSSTSKTPKLASRNSSTAKTPKSASRNSSPTKTAKPELEKSTLKKTSKASNLSLKLKSPKVTRKSSPKKRQTPKSTSRKALNKSKTPKTVSRRSSPNKAQSPDVVSRKTTPKLNINNVAGDVTPENTSTPTEQGTPVLNMQSFLDESIRQSNHSFVKQTVRRFESLGTPMTPVLKTSARRTIGGISDNILKRKYEIEKSDNKSRTDPRNKLKGISKTKGTPKTKMNALKKILTRNSKRSSDGGSVASDKTDENAPRPDDEDSITPKSTVKLAPEPLKEKHSTAKKAISRKTLIDHLYQSKDTVKQLFSSPVKRKLSQSMIQYNNSIQLSDDDEINDTTTSRRSRFMKSINVTFDMQTPNVPMEMFVSPLETTSRGKGFKRGSSLFLTKTPSKLANSPSKTGKKKSAYKQKSPRNDLTNVAGVKRLFESGRKRKLEGETRNDLINISGVKTLYGSTNKNKSPRNDLRNVPNIRSLFSPKRGKTSGAGLQDFSGVQELFNTSAHNSLNKSKSEALFDRVAGKSPVKTYTPAKRTSKSSPKTRPRSISVDPENVEQWLENEIQKRVSVDSSHSKSDNKRLSKSATDIMMSKSPKKSQPKTRGRRKGELDNLTIDMVESSVTATPGKRQRRLATNEQNMSQNISKPGRNKAKRTPASELALPLKKRNLSVDKNTSETKKQKLDLSISEGSLPLKKRSLLKRQNAIDHSTPVKSRIRGSVRESVELGHVSPIPTSPAVTPKKDASKVSSLEESTPKGKSLKRGRGHQNNTSLEDTVTKQTSRASKSPSLVVAKKTLKKPAAKKTTARGRRGKAVEDSESASQNNATRSPPKQISPKASPQKSPTPKKPSAKRGRKAQQKDVTLDKSMESPKVEKKKPSARGRRAKKAAESVQSDGETTNQKMEVKTRGKKVERSPEKPKSPKPKRAGRGKVKSIESPVKQDSLKVSPMKEPSPAKSAPKRGRGKKTTVTTTKSAIRRKVEATPSPKKMTKSATISPEKSKKSPIPSPKAKRARSKKTEQDFKTQKNKKTVSFADDEQKPTRGRRKPQEPEAESQPGSSKTKGKKGKSSSQDSTQSPPPTKRGKQEKAPSLSPVLSPRKTRATRRR